MGSGGSIRLDARYVPRLALQRPPGGKMTPYARFKELAAGICDSLKTKERCEVANRLYCVCQGETPAPAVEWLQGNRVICFAYVRKLVSVCSVTLVHARTTRAVYYTAPKKMYSTRHGH